MGAPGSGTAYLYRCTGEHDPDGIKHDHPVYGTRDKQAMDLRIADDFAFCDCGSPLRRVYSFIAGKPMPEHFNLAAGTYVRNERELNDVYKRKSDEVSERLNLAHDFQPVSQTDKQALGVTASGLEETIKRRTDTGLRVTPELRSAADDN